MGGAHHKPGEGGGSRARSQLLVKNLNFFLLLPFGLKASKTCTNVLLCVFCPYLGVVKDRLSS